MSARRKARNRKARNIVITPKGYAILTLIDIGAYKYLSARENAMRALKIARRKLRKMRRESAR